MGEVWHVSSELFIDELCWRRGSSVGLAHCFTWEVYSPKWREKCPVLPPTWQLCPKTSKAIFEGEIAGSEQVSGKKSPCLKASEAYIFQSEWDNDFNWGKAGIFFRPLSPDGAQAISSDEQSVCSTGRNRALQKSLLGLLGTSRALPETSQPGQLHPESQRFTHILCLPGPWSPGICSATASDTQASGKEEYVSGT